MDDHHSTAAAATPSISWSPCFWNDQLQQDESLELENLKQALLRTTLELESTRVIAQEELKKLKSQSLHLAHLLQVATRQRDDARRHCHQLSLLLQQSQTPTPNHNSHNPAAAAAAAPNLATSSSSSEVEEEVEVHAVRKRGLPEKGRLVEAVMRAGPLLKTLMLAGPLPEWRHPPPAMKSFEIPPVEMMSGGDEGRRRRRKTRGREESNEEDKVLVVSLGSSPESNHS